MDLEPGIVQRILVVNFTVSKILEAVAGDEDPHSVPLDDLVARLRLGDLHGVLQAGAAAFLHKKPQSRLGGRGAAGFEQIAEVSGGVFGDGHEVEAGERECPSGGGRNQAQPRRAPLRAENIDNSPDFRQNTGSLHLKEALPWGFRAAEAKPSTEKNPNEISKNEIDMNRKFAIILGAAAAVLIGFSVTTRADDDVISKFMKEYHKAPEGTDPVCKKAGAGTATAEELQGLLDGYKKICGTEPPQGDKAVWVKNCQALVAAVKGLQEGKEGAAADYKKAVNCKGCHNDFKP